MKKQLFISMLALVLILSFFSLSFAQRPGMGQGMRMGQGQGPGMRNAQGPGMGMCANIPELTDAQKTKIEKLWLAHQKEAQPKRLEMEKMRIELHELMIADKPNFNKITAKQEEMSKVRLEMQKNGAIQRLAVRELLTEKQRLFFDKRPMGRKGAGFHKGRRGGCQGPNCGRGMRGPGRGRGMGNPPVMAPNDEN